MGVPLWFYRSEDFIPESIEKIIQPADENKTYISGTRPADSTVLNFLLLLAHYDSTTRTPEEGPPLGEREFNLLWRLYDYRKKMTEKEDKPAERDTYVRHRILWRLMHYERVNDYTTLDVFPGITWDSKPGEKEVFSFLWRFVRYEWHREKGTQFYLFFIPF